TDVHDAPDPAGVTVPGALREIEVAAADAVDAGWTTAALERLVRVPSVTGDEGAVQDAVADLLAEIGIPAERLEPDPAEARADRAGPGEEMPGDRLRIVLGRLGSGGGRRIVLVGHVDVVPVGDPATWTRDPWAAERDGDRLYGRGAVDMKGGVASILGALHAL